MSKYTSYINPASSSLIVYYYLTFEKTDGLMGLSPVVVTLSSHMRECTFLIVICP